MRKQSLPGNSIAYDCLMPSYHPLILVLHPQEYLFIPAKVKEVYLAHVLGRLQELKVRSAIIFTSSCKGCHLLSLVLEELGLACASLHSGACLCWQK